MIEHCKSDPRAVSYAYDEFSKEIIKRFSGDSTFDERRSVAHDGQADKLQSFLDDAADYSNLLHESYMQCHGNNIFFLRRSLLTILYIIIL